MPERWEWAVMIAFNVVMIGLLVAAYQTGRTDLALGTLLVAGMTIGFGR